MAVKPLRACRKCSQITDEDACPHCGGETSKEWQGYVIILDHRKSEIAKKLNVNVNGRYALRVR